MDVISLEKTLHLMKSLENNDRFLVLTSYQYSIAKPWYQANADKIFISDKIGEQKLVWNNGKEIL